MLTEKAIEYNSFLSEVFDHINNFQVMVEFNNYTKGGIEKLKEIYSIDELNKRRDSFKEEVEINIAEYQEKDIIDEYFLTTLSKWINWEGFEFDYNQNIIKSGIEVNYLLKLKIEFEKQVYHLIDFANFRRPKGEYTNTFIEFFDTVMRKINSTNFSQKFEDFINELDNPKKYDFDLFQLELAQLTTNEEKIGLIKQRLIDFEQWQVKNNMVDNDSFWGSVNPGRSEFAKLCRIEMKRYPVEKDETKKVEPTQPTISNPYKWAMYDTDFLELFTALYQNECIERKDGKSFSRKELLDYFQGILGLDIKDVESKLTKAGNRNEKTPFLDDLKSAFEIFVEQKEKKLLKRK